jgi:hypothetical protein
MKTKKKKKPQRPDPKVFEKAVKLFGNEHEKWSCCGAILCFTDQDSVELKFFWRLFGRQSRCLNWWPYPDQGVRVIALQLAACVAKDNAL